MKNTGFTLAEVLITLGIIGVVAALTIPGLLTKINNIKLKSQFKEGYSLLAQAVRMYNQDDDKDEKIALHRQFMKYFKGATDCGNTVEVEDDSKFCIIRQSNVDGNAGTVTNKDYQYKNYAKNTYFIRTNHLDDGQFFLNNGMLIIFDRDGGNKLISIDINGKLQKPNAWGHDVFTFQLQDDAKEGGYILIPIGAKRTQYAGRPQTLCSKTSNNPENGFTCSYYAMSDNDYFNNLP